MTAAFVFACAVLVYTSFCRLVKMERSTTRFGARVGFVGMATAAAYGVMSATFWGYLPGWPGAALATAAATIQLLASRAWRQGVPTYFRD